LSTKNLSAEKRMRQNEKRRLRNKSAKSAIRTASKKVVVAAQANNVADAKAALQDMIKRIDTAARKGIVKKNTAARKKSRMQKLVNRLEG
jgi:small subunit ribosomal protein S20